MEGNDKRRMGVRLNLDHKLGTKGYLMMSVNGGFSKTKTPNGTKNDPTSLVYELNPYETKSESLWSYPGQTYYELTHQYSAESSDKNAGASVIISLNPIEGLNISAVAGLDFVLGEGNQFTPSTAYSETHSGVPEYARGIYTKYKNTTINRTSNIRLTYNRQFGKKNDLTIGCNMDYYRTDTDSELIRGYGVGTLNTAAAINQSLQGTRQPYVSAPRDKTAQLGFGGVAGYTFDSTYDVYATLKADASSVLPRDKRWNRAWAIGTGLTLTKYKMLANLKWLSYQNLKFSYGQTANLNGVSTSQTVASFQYSTSSYENCRPLDFVTLYNKDLVPERNITSDIGLSAEFLKRITLDMNLYSRKTKQALLDVPIPSSTGYTMLKRNIGVLLNKGIEIGLNFRILDSNNWRMTVGANIAYNENKVLDLYLQGRSVDLLVPVFSPCDPVLGPVLEFHHTVYLTLPQSFILRKIVERENVDGYPLVVAVLGLEFVLVHTGGTAVPYLGKAEHAAWIGVFSLEEIRFCKFAGSDLAEGFIVIPHHADIDVVVPWNESFVPYGAKESAPRGEKCQSMLPADPVQLGKHVKFNCPYFLHLP